MKKNQLLIVVLTLIFQFNSQETNAQFGLKKLKNNLIKSATKEIVKQKDSIQSKAINKAFDKIHSLCTGSSDSSVTLTEKNSAYQEYQNLKSEIDKFETNLKEMNIIALATNSNKLLKSLKAIKTKEPNVNLTSECSRISSLKSKFLK